MAARMPVPCVKLMDAFVISALRFPDVVFLGIDFVLPALGKSW